MTSPPDPASRNTVVVMTATAIHLRSSLHLPSLDERYSLEARGRLNGCSDPREKRCTSQSGGSHEEPSTLVVTIRLAWARELSAGLGSHTAPFALTFRWSRRSGGGGNSVRTIPLRVMLSGSTLGAGLLLLPQDLVSALDLLRATRP
jgi:hypothetical protein